MSKVFKKRVAIPIYFGYLEIIICKSLSEAAGQLAKYEIRTPDSLDNYGAFTVIRRKKSGPKVYGVFLGPGCTAGLIAHEATHVKNYLFKEVGQQLDLVNDEAEAYLMGWITREIYEYYQQKKNKLQ